MLDADADRQCLELRPLNLIGTLRAAVRSSQCAGTPQLSRGIQSRSRHVLRARGGTGLPTRRPSLTLSLIQMPVYFTAAVQTAVGSFMIARKSLFQCGPMLATAVSFSVLSTTADAYTPEQQQMCTGDAFRLCSSEIPDVDRVTACMVRQKNQLSPGCRVFFEDPEPELRPVVRRKPTATQSHKTGKAKKPRKPH
jgi:hypothetical protein